VKILLAAGGKSEQQHEGWPSLSLAASEGHADVTRVLVEDGGAVDHRRGTADNRWTAMHGADAEKNSALIQAAQHGHADVARELIAGRVAEDSLSQDGLAALLVAAQHGHADVATVLLEDGKTVDRRGRSAGFTALMIAAQNGHETVIKVLLAHGAPVNEQTKYGWTALMLAAQEGNTVVVKLLLEAGAEVAAVGGPSRYSPLIFAAHRGHTEVVKVLMEAGADLSQQSDSGWTALSYAARQGQVDVVYLLVSTRKKEMDKLAFEPRIAFELIYRKFVDHESDDGTPLMLAAEGGHDITVRTLLNAGAKKDMYLPTPQQFETVQVTVMTALAMAAKQGHTKVVQVLLEYGAQPNLILENGFTALMYAAKVRPLQWSAVTPGLQPLVSAEQLPC
jgi:ankyrin repeat protein